MSLSNNKIKYIRSLKEKKLRSEHHTFVAEGTKLVFDLLETCRCQLVAALPETLAAHPDIRAEEIVVASASELKKATLLATAPQIIAIFYQPEQDVEKYQFGEKLSLVLDGIQDPGNVGTIIRIADWFGIDHVVCSPDTADLFNPKTVQATMGAIARIRVSYTDIGVFLRKYSHLPIYGTFLDGKNIYHEELSDYGLIVMGSEGKGIRKEAAESISRRLFIPNFPLSRTTSESLNVAAATAIVCSEFRRRKL
ncbi:MULTISPECIES: RNA methyltransferase [unclassified Proteiniphilum]|jgi:TrmH family RNA methyltransferase|uniref:RNA methyltransferase n=1 Tax=unclassified Proteiniphilum TaxID=2622718 RepID=UPI000E927CF6|nr:MULTISPECIES: RNA methyltransferase [unclassified Proteiniphilum]HBG56480.1 RNA methyltransferase [Porphyromonadaceae bacterium]